MGAASSGVLITEVIYIRSIYVCYGRESFVGCSPEAYVFESTTTIHVYALFNSPKPINQPTKNQVAHWSTHEEGKGVLPLRVGDVLMEVDGLAVDDTGVVAMPPHRLQVGGGMGGCRNV